MSAPRRQIVEASAPARALNTLWRRLVRASKRVLRPLWMRHLDARNRLSREPVIDDNGPVVSLTTFGDRLAQVHLTLESIGAGRQRPSRLLLWVDQGQLDAAPLPAPLLRLVARGLEVRGCQDVGPHTKYWPSVAQLPLDRPLVTADDDVLYPRGWLAELQAAGRQQPDWIHCHRAHHFSFDPAGQPLPYARWPACAHTRPGHRAFFTGVAGVLYPPAMQQALREAGPAFLACCPKADDIWLNAVAWRLRMPVHQLRPFHPVLFERPGTRAGGLARHNVQGGGNDAQLLATYTPDELAALRASD